MGAMNLIPFLIGLFIVAGGMIITFQAITRAEYKFLLASIPLIAMGLFCVYRVFGEWMSFMLWQKIYGG